MLRKLKMSLGLSTLGKVTYSDLVFSFSWYKIQSKTRVHMRGKKHWLSPVQKEGGLIVKPGVKYWFGQQLYISPLFFLLSGHMFFRPMIKYG